MSEFAGHSIRRMFVRSLSRERTRLPAESRLAASDPLAPALSGGRDLLLAPSAFSMGDADRARRTVPIEFRSGVAAGGSSRQANLRGVEGGLPAGNAVDRAVRSDGTPSGL